VIKLAVFVGKDALQSTQAQAFAVIDPTARGRPCTRALPGPDRRGCAAVIRDVPILQARVSSDRKETQMRGSTSSSVGENAGVHGGPVMLDIGGDVGALVVYLPDSFAGTEIEIGWSDSDEPFTHTGVHPRGTGETLHQTAVYPELKTGDYQLWHPYDASLLGPAVHVEGGAVAELNLLDLAPEPPSGQHNHNHGHGHNHSH